MHGFGSQDLDHLVLVSGFESGFGYEDLDLWVWISGFGSLGFGLRISTPGLSQDLDHWI